jgi:low affinity Fe/Cu permease
LVLFVDNEDMPRIPKKLFEDVCEIKVAGVPGPVYLGLLLALKQFSKIVIFIMFVFVVILSFGSVYKVSSTNQMIAALAGGSLPFILRTFMEPEKPEIEMGSVSFKSKLDEIIKNFAQYWPIYDIAFEVYKPEEEKENEEKDKDKRADTEEKDTDKRAGTPYKVINETTAEPSTKNYFQFPGEDTIDGMELTSNTHVTQANNNHTSTSNHTTLGPTESSASTKIRFQEPEKVPTVKVDILIYLPDQFEEYEWLEQWSDV